MTPQVHLNGTDRVAQAAPDSFPTTVATRAQAPEPRELTFAERQGLAMGWVAIALGTFLLLGGLALWAAVALNVGFGGWLIGLALMGAVMVVTIVAVGYFVIRPGR